MTGDLRGNGPGTLRGIHRGSPGRLTGHPPANRPGFSREIHRGFPGEFAGDFPWELTGNPPGNLPGLLRGTNRGLPGSLSGKVAGLCPGDPPGILRGIYRGLCGGLTGDLPGHLPGNVPRIHPGICRANPPLVPSSTTTVAHLRYRSRRTWDRSCSVAPRRPAHQLRAQQRGGRQGALVRFDVQATINVRARSDTVLLISLVISWSLARAAAGH